MQTPQKNEKRKEDECNLGFVGFDGSGCFAQPLGLLLERRKARFILADLREQCGFEGLVGPGALLCRASLLLVAVDGLLRCGLGLGLEQREASALESRRSRRLGTLRYALPHQGDLSRCRRRLLERRELCLRRSLGLCLCGGPLRSRKSIRLGLEQSQLQGRVLRGGKGECLLGRDAMRRRALLGVSQLRSHGAHLALLRRGRGGDLLLLGLDLALGLAQEARHDGECADLGRLASLGLGLDQSLAKSAHASLVLRSRSEHLSQVLRLAFGARFSLLRRHRFKLRRFVALFGCPRKSRSGEGITGSLIRKLGFMQTL